MKIAVAVTSDFDKIAGHAGRARRWLIFERDGQDILAPKRLLLAPERVFHFFRDAMPPDLLGIDVMIARSAGERLLARLSTMGVVMALTAETNPLKAVSDYLGPGLAPPKPRPIGSLICKTIDALAKHK